MLLLTIMKTNMQGVHLIPIQLKVYGSQLKRTIKGTHIKVSKKHLQKYVDEVVFRYSHRDKQDTMFEAILNQML